MNIYRGKIMKLINEKHESMCIFLLEFKPTAVGR